MNAVHMHRLLRRQIKKHNIPEDCLTEYSSFFKAINDAYLANDKDRAHLENILETSSQELYRANNLLKQENLAKSKEIIKAKGQLDRVLFNVTDAIYELDEKGRFTFLNSAWEEYAEEKIEDCLGKHYIEFTSRIASLDTNLRDRIFNEGVSDFRSIFSRYTKSGELKWWELSNKFFYDENGNQIGAIGSITDVTQMKEKEDKLRKLSEVKSKFLSTMSHEIRTPLNAIVAISNILLMDEPCPSKLENYNALKFSSEHLLTLINDILDYNKLEAGHLEFLDEPFNLHYIVDGIINSFKYSAEEKGIELKHEVFSCVPHIIRGDATRLSQVLTNLISNGIKFTSSGYVSVRILCLDNDGENVRVRFTVKDTGIGIAEKDLEHIFQRFSQANKNISVAYGGTGLGLAISKKIVELQNGKIEVDSTLGEGTLFSFTLNFGVVKDKKTISFRSAPVKDVDLEGMRVLLVDDNEMNLLVANQMLKKWKVDVMNVANGKEAFELVQQSDFDVVLMDLRMPVMDGYEATEAIRALGGEYEKLPIVAMTASVSNDIQAKVKASKMDAYLTKPFNPMDLLSRLEKFKRKQARMKLG